MGRSVLRRITLTLLSLLLLVALAAGVFELRHQSGNDRARALFLATDVEPVRDLGSTRSLRILPLPEFHSTDPALT